MKTTTSCELRVSEVFRFEDGRTVFAGRLLGDEIYIPPCRAELLVNGNVVAVLHVEGEMLPNGDHGAGWRSVSTTEAIGPDVRPANNIDVRLRFDLGEPRD